MADQESEVFASYLTTITAELKSMQDIKEDYEAQKSLLSGDKKIETLTAQIAKMEACVDSVEDNIKASRIESYQLSKPAREKAASDLRAASKKVKKMKNEIKKMEREVRNVAEDTGVKIDSHKAKIHSMEDSNEAQVKGVIIELQDAHAEADISYEELLQQKNQIQGFEGHTTKIMDSLNLSARLLNTMQQRDKLNRLKVIGLMTCWLGTMVLSGVIIWST